MTVRELLLILDSLAAEGYGKAQVRWSIGDTPLLVATRAVTKVEVEQEMIVLS